MGNNNYLKYWIFLFVFVLSLPSALAISDDDKQKQVASMEYKKWDFSPGAWYWTFHNNGYAGAYLKLNWLVNAEIKFKESKSNVKRVGPVRAATAAAEVIHTDQVKKEHCYIDTIWKEEVYRQADRLIDLTYEDYKDEFDDLSNKINDNLMQAQIDSNGQLYNEVSALLDEYHLVFSHIAEIHASGVQNQIENSARQELYEDAHKMLVKIAKSSYKLALRAHCMKK